MDVKETKELCVFVARTVNAVDASTADGKITLADTANLIEPLMSAGPALTGVSSVPSELADLTPAEAEEIKQAIASELNLANDKVEAVAEEIVGAALQLAAAVLAVKMAKTPAPTPLPAA